MVKGSRWIRWFVIPGYGRNDANTNRTSLVTTAGAALASPTATALCDLTGATPVTVTSTYDAADRATGTGYTYDTLARTTALPAAAVSGGNPLTVGYATNDMVATLTQAGRTKTYTLDPARRILTTTDTAGPDTHQPLHRRRRQPRLDRLIRRRLDPLPQRTLRRPRVHRRQHRRGPAPPRQPPRRHRRHPRPHRHHPRYQPRNDEYGLTLAHTAPGRRYGWLGSQHRTTGTPTAPILMGVRLYMPSTGRFLTVDPVPGGGDNAYAYSFTDPINKQDLDGRFWGVLIRGGAQACKRWCGHGARKLASYAKSGRSWARRQAVRSWVNFGAGLQRSRWFGDRSLLFGSSGAGPGVRQGLLNRSDRAWRIGWSTKGYGKTKKSRRVRWTFRIRYPSGQHKDVFYGRWNYKKGS